MLDAKIAFLKSFEEGNGADTVLFNVFMCTCDKDVISRGIEAMSRELKDADRHGTGARLDKVATWPEEEEYEKRSQGATSAEAGSDSTPVDKAFAVGLHPAMLRACNHALVWACDDGNMEGVRILLDSGLGRAVLPRALGAAASAGQVELVRSLLSYKALFLDAPVQTAMMLSTCCKAVLRFVRKSSCTDFLRKTVSDQKQRRDARAGLKRAKTFREAHTRPYIPGSPEAGPSGYDSDDSSVNSDLMPDTLESLCLYAEYDEPHIPTYGFRADGPKRDAAECFTMVLQQWPATSDAWAGMEADLLLAACASGLPTVVQAAVERCQSGLERRLRAETLRTALRIACRAGGLAVVEALLAAGARPWWHSGRVKGEDESYDWDDTHGTDALIMAAKHGHTRIVQALLSHYGSAIAPGNVNQAFQDACKEGRVETAKCLLAVPRAITGITTDGLLELIATEVEDQFDTYSGKNKPPPAIGKLIPLLLAAVRATAAQQGPGVAIGSSSGGAATMPPAWGVPLPQKLVDEGPALLKGWAKVGQTAVVLALLEAGVDLIDRELRQQFKPPAEAAAEAAAACGSKATNKRLPASVDCSDSDSDSDGVSSAGSDSDEHDQDGRGRGQGRQAQAAGLQAGLAAGFPGYLPFSLYRSQPAPAPAPASPAEAALESCALGHALQLDRAEILALLLQQRPGQESLPPKLLSAAMKRAVAKGYKQAAALLWQADGIGRKEALAAAAKLGLQDVLPA